ncbi:hypothetical protein B0H11DRAFT_1941922 [Mycena galericulata]|nr:hypothetical protein B0H11DRAFT_1941922 [Mycena galericulata]
MSRANRSSGSKKEAASSATHQHSFNLGVLFPGAELVSAPMQTFVERPSADRRRLHRELVEVEPPSPVKRARMEVANSASTAPPVSAPSTADPFSEPWEADRYTMMEDDDPPLPDLPPFPESRAFKPADPAMDRWLRTLRDVYLRAMLRRDGRGDADGNICPGCCRPESAPTYRCGECAGGQLFCDLCCVKRHLDNPLHVIYRWSGVFFTKTSLKTLGLRIQLGHPPAQRCANPQAGNQDFVVIHDNSIHEVAVDFCGCDRENAGLPYIQLLRAGWYPATEHRPQTAATFVVLDKFHLHTLQAKTTAYDFYSVLERLTDNTGVKPPNRYQIFLSGARPLRGLRYWIRGVGGGMSGLPASGRESTRWLGERGARGQRRMISNEIKDPGLGTGWAYVMENAPYRHFLRTVTDQKEHDGGGDGRCDKDRGATAVERGMGWMILRRERSVAFFFEFTQRLALLWPQVRVVYRENPSKGMVSKMTATSTELCSIPGGVIRQGTTSVVSTICQFSSSPFPLLQKDEFAQEGALGSSVVNVWV